MDDKTAETAGATNPEKGHQVHKDDGKFGH
jgi:hypothetical protein